MPAMTRHVLIEGADILTFSAAEMRQMRGKDRMMVQASQGSSSPRCIIAKSAGEPLQVCGPVKDRRKKRERVAELLNR